MAVVIRDSVINEGFNIAQPWAAAVGSNRAFSGNVGAQDDKGNPQRNLNDNGFNRMWEYNNRGVGSFVVAARNSNIIGPRSPTRRALQQAIV